MAETPDWFKEVVSEAEKSDKAREAAARREAARQEQALAQKEALKVEQARKKLLEESARSSMTSAAAASAALEEFGKVAAGAMPSYTPMSGAARSRTQDMPRNGGPKIAPVERVTAKRGLEAILKEVRSAPDPYIAAGEWIGIVTNELTKIAQEHLED